MKPNRYPIAIDNGVFLCNDGTMWKRVPVTAYDGKISSGWIQLDNVPQSEGVKVSVTESSKEFVTLHAYTDNCCTE